MNLGKILVHVRLEKTNEINPWVKVKSELEIRSECMCTLALGVSRSLPMVDISLQRHSSDSSCSSVRSLTTQLCMMFAVNIFSLKSSPISFIFPRERRRLLKWTFSSFSLSC